jgi:hypothetical protein
MLSKRVVPKKIFGWAILGIVVLGLGIGLYGAYQYVDAELKLRDNRAEQLIESGEEVEVNSFNEGYELFESSVERDELHDQRADALPFIGVGIAIIGVGWLGYEFLPALRKNRHEATLAREAHSTN